MTRSQKIIDEHGYPQNLWITVTSSQKTAMSSLQNILAE
jgi:hypothetical protein